MDVLKLLRLLVIYVVLLGIERVVPIDALKSLANAVAVAIPLILVVDYLLSTRPMLIPAPVAAAIALVVVALAGSWAVNGIANVADFTKILLLPVFVLLGFNAAVFDRSDPEQIARLKRLSAVLLAVPLVLLAVNDWLPADDPSVISIFANRNNAGLYMVGLANVLFLLGVRLSYIVAFLGAVALMFSTLGVLLAVVLALVFSLSLRRYAGLYLLVSIAAIALATALPELTIFKRVSEVFENISAVTQAGLWTELDRMSYRDLYLLTGSSTDLSLFFRIKHWQDLWAAYVASDWSSLLFGLGVGASVYHTDLGLVPHNDYLRFMVETGPLGFAGFTMLTLYLVARIGRRAFVISTAAVALYFMSDNLINNFPAMAMYYFFAGYWMQHADATAQADAGGAELLDPDAETTTA